MAYRILVVEDDFVVRRLLQVLLSSDKHVVIEAHDGQQALRLAENDPVDLICTDLMMPVMDGFTLIEQVRSHPKTANIPILIITAADRHQYLKRAMQLGANGFVMKPFTKMQLLESVQQVMASVNKG
jgi:two-component system chemotaxis response regulator CheY